MQYWCKEIESDPRYIGVGAARGLPDGAYIKGVAPNVNLSLIHILPRIKDFIGYQLYLRASLIQVIKAIFCL